LSQHTARQLPTPTLYFGYGSNLNRDDLSRWAAARSLPPLTIEPLQTAWLPDYVPIFDYFSRARGGGALNLRPQRGGLTPGVLFRSEIQDWAVMDRKEGTGGGFYRRLAVWTLDHRGNRTAAETYEVCPDRRGAFCAPTAPYLQAVHEGFDTFGLDTTGLDAAARGEPIPFAVRHLFVYGTLRRGGRRHELLSVREREALRPATIEGQLLNLRDYPGFVPGPGVVHGELITLEQVADQLSQLDGVEGFKGYGSPLSIFHRVLVLAHPEAGEPVLAWAYAVVRPPVAALLIASGDWFEG
jgi:gamma-glutamylcyclotransferase (GGCT)/AIG2-like uncharacterized protein YtfP